VDPLAGDGEAAVYFTVERDGFDCVDLAVSD